jgi:hypothetical protein
MTFRHLHHFIRGLDTDHAAVPNGLTLPYSSGAVEGHVNRIKMVKWQMYGPAGVDFENEYFTATEAFRTDHGNWVRTTSQPSSTLGRVAKRVLVARG